ncbi:PAS domain S-box-containing protein [Catenuloplanes nepalensis]|uniref:Sensor-like histidine kinase SenX3 n=1 Tax=Catenuloplanes nepalensis TaxID=587533 RepID=A0ABT9N0M0_9ACTN|nr:ATP-binding protein [Catenuloplanes nepalensis]MDP9797209.1 PAS domain S-box-containing protein [Catenuloplanes nepalensis]
MGGWHGRRGALVVAGIVLVIGLAAMSATGWALHRQDIAAANRIMEQRTSLAQTAVSVETRRYVDLLRTAATGLGEASVLDARTFQAGTAPLAGTDLPGATSVVYVAPVPSGQVAAAQARWRKLGAGPLTLTPMAGSTEHLFTVWSRTLDGGVPPALGVDLTRAREPTAALSAARRTGRATVSDAYVLLRDEHLPAAQRQRSFVFAAPIHRGGAFAGWLVMGMRGQDFLGDVLVSAGQKLLGGSLSATDGTGMPTTVATVTAPGRPDLHRERTVGVADRRWTLTTTADSSRLPGGHSALPLTTGLAGSAIVALLAGLIYVLSTGRARAEAGVVAATAELRQAEREARRQSGLLAAVMNSIGDGVGVVDEHGAFLLHNRAARALLGVREDIAGLDGWQEHYGIFRPDGTPFPAEQLPLARALAGESSDGVEMVIRNPNRPDGVLISVDGRPLDPAAGQRGAVAVFRDITELRRYETDLAAFAGVVAHDLKSPLAIVSGHCEAADEILAEVLADPPGGTDEGAWRPAANEAREAIGHAVRGVHRMGALIDDLLAYTTARDAPLRLRAVDLAALAAEVVAERTSRGAVGDRPAPRIFVGDLPEVIADAGMLRRVLENLIGNSVKYVRAGTSAHVDVTATADPVGWAHIQIADRGIGIPDADKPHVFESFHRAHEGTGYAGTGLGLAICRRIVERHGGTVAVADNPGGGTRFSFTLPLATALSGPVASPHRSGERIAS